MENRDSYILSLPKGELHLHLNGVVSSETIKRIITDEKIELPPDFNLDIDLIRSQPAPSLQEYLKPWEVLRLVPNTKENLNLIVEDAFKNLKKENIKFAEIRNSIIYIANNNDISVEKAMSWLLEGLEKYSEEYAIKSGLIITITRSENSINHLRNLIKAYKKLGKPKNVIGFDLAGNEDTPVPLDLGKEFLRMKREYGLKLTVHAGETGKIENIRAAVDDYGADRIGHGTAAGESIETMQYLKEKNICVEVCPISNRLTNSVRENDAHPVSKFLEAEVPFVLCSDNPGIHIASLSDDYKVFLNETQNIAALENMFEQQKKYTFLKV